MSCFEKYCNFRRSFALPGPHIDRCVLLKDIGARGEAFFDEFHCNRFRRLFIRKDSVDDAVQIRKQGGTLVPWVICGIQSL